MYKSIKYPSATTNLSKTTMMSGRFILLLAGILPATFAQTNYCDRTLCRPGKQHIACNNNGAFQAACGQSSHIIRMDSNLISQILNQHNKYRNLIAQGFNKFQPAARMATIQWNSELAHLAELNVKQCVMKHDQCHNTKYFKHAGQNLAYTKWIGKQMSVSPVVNDQIKAWFDEYKICPVDFVHKFPLNKNSLKIGHFTAMIQDKSTHVGCAIAKYIKSNGYTEQLMACNYAYTNVIGRSAYEIGKAGSKCKTGVNPFYRFLCSPKEYYNVNVL